MKDKVSLHDTKFAWSSCSKSTLEFHGSLQGASWVVTDLCGLEDLNETIKHIFI